MEKPFNPGGAGSVNIDVSASSQRTTLPGVGSRQIRVMNNGSATAWFEFGSADVSAAVDTGVAVAAGASAIFTTSATHVAAIAAAATGKIYFRAGGGS